jgi:hypothetical protein
LHGLLITRLPGLDPGSRFLIARREKKSGAPGQARGGD